MTVRQIPAEDVLDANLVSSNVPEDDYPVYSSGTSYSTDDLVIYEHRIWRSLQNSNSGNTPGQSEDFWFDEGSTNRWKAFDEYIGDPTTQQDSVQWVLTFEDFVDSVCLYGVKGATVQIQARDEEGTLYYNETYNLQDDTHITDFYEYFFSPIRRRSKLIVTDIPPFLNSEITVTVEEEGYEIQVGQLVVGRAEIIGVALNNLPLGFEDYSKVERDFDGRAEVVQRDFTETINISFVTETVAAEYVTSRVIARRAKPTVYAVDSEYRMNDYSVYGFPKDFSLIARYGSMSEGNVELEGIT